MVLSCLNLLIPTLSSFADPKPDPTGNSKKTNCSYWKIDDVPINPIPRIFEADDLAFEKFIDLYKTDKNAAIKFWITSIGLFTPAEAPNLEVTFAGQDGGKNNLGIFYINKKHQPPLYIVKRNQRCTEFERLWQVNASVLANPECFSNFKNKIPPHTTEESYFKDIPKISRILKSGRIESSCFGVLEIAPGERLDKIWNTINNGGLDENKIKEIFTEIGKKFGSMHYFFRSDESHFSKFSKLSTLNHTDSTESNVFYDPVKKNVTLIDNGSLSHIKSGQTLYTSLYLLIIDRLENSNTKSDTTFKNSLWAYRSFARGYI